jgi:hypothetical protein
MGRFPSRDELTREKRYRVTHTYTMEVVWEVDAVSVRDAKLSAEDMGEVGGEMRQTTNGKWTVKEIGGR